MTTSASRNPRAATCEDVEDDYEPSLPDSNSNPDANVARKRAQSHRSDPKISHDKKSYNGSDSGYSSKAGTNDDISSDRRKTVDLKIDTDVNMERDRQPYAYKPSRPEPSRQPSVKTKDTTKEKPTRQQEQAFRHAVGDCITCDRYGYHFEPTPPIPESQQPPKVSRKSSTKTKDDSTIRQKSRRQSSVHDKRPSSMYVVPPLQVNYAPEYGHHVIQQSPYVYQVSTPITPTNYAVPYHYPQQQYVPDTPISNGYPGYFEQQVNHYDVHQPPPQQYIQYHEQVEPIQPQYVQYQTQEQHQRHPSNGSTTRPVIVKSSKSVEDDKRAMPPPSRPVPRKSSTDRSSKRQSVHYEDNERPDITSKRSSRDMSHPPSAYNQPRPRPSKSYSTGSGPVQVPATQRPRHNTDPSGYNDHIDQRTANAESYIARTSKGPAIDLTAESLKKMSPKPPASDSGTHRSHRSKESTRSKVSTRTTIRTDSGVSVSLPQNLPERITLQLGNLVLSVNTQDQENEAAEQRRIETRALNDASRAPSRRSTTSNSNLDGQRITRDTARKYSQPERADVNTSTSKRSSRTPSSTRGNLDHDQRRSPDNSEAYYG